MPAFTRGKLSFDKVQHGTTESPEEIIAVYDCAPPPRGSRQNSNPAAQWPAELLPAYLQGSEISRIIDGASVPQGPNDFGTILITAMASLGLKPLAIDLSKLPAGWGQITQCLRTTLAYVVQSDVIDVDVTAAQEVTLGGEVYPQGDRVASFRVLNPRRYRFVRRYAHNPECCKDAYHFVPPMEQSDWFPETERDVTIELGPDYHWGNDWHLKPDWGLKYNFYKYDLSPYQSEGEPDPGGTGRLRREIEELRRQLRDLQDRLRRLSEGGGR